MKRSVLAIAGLLLLLLLGLGVRPAIHAGAKTTASGFVGSWRVTISQSGRPDNVNVATMGADGTLTTAGPPVSPAPPGSSFKLIYASGGHGVWQSTGPQSAAITFVVLDSDEAGHFIGTATIRGAQQLAASGDAWSGSFTVTIADPTGKVVAERSGTVKATRIVVEPMASPTS